MKIIIELENSNYYINADDLEYNISFKKSEVVNLTIELESNPLIKSLSECFKGPGRECIICKSLHNRIPPTCSESCSNKYFENNYENN